MSTDEIIIEPITPTPLEVETVMRRIKESCLDHPPFQDYPVDEGNTRDSARSLLSKGWETTDVVRYLCNTEEVNPFISEARGLAGMARIRFKYEPECFPKGIDAAVDEIWAKYDTMPPGC